jgi:hypothetical protein
VALVDLGKRRLGQWHGGGILAFPAALHWPTANPQAPESVIRKGLRPHLAGGPKSTNRRGGGRRTLWLPALAFRVGAAGVETPVNLARSSPPQEAMQWTHPPFVS